MENRSVDLEKLFAQALELQSGTERNDFVADRCGHDQEARQELESLLRAHEAAKDFLAPTADTESTESVEGDQDKTNFPKVPGYRILHPLGAGGLGVVYAAVDEKLQRRVAIKVLRHLGPTTSKDRVRLLGEARRAATLSHPAVVTVFSVLDETEPPAIVMEWVEGFPLDKFAAELTFPQKARLLLDVAHGMSAAHALGLVHRDLKPQNILVGPDMRPKILDFGLCQSVEDAAVPGLFQGTPLYASPEQARGGSLTTASDVFSFGSLMFKVLTGRAPFEGASSLEVLEAIGRNRPPLLLEVAVGVPEDLQAICVACMALNPADRPVASQVAVELGRYLIGEPVRLRPRLYDDVLRQSITQHAEQARGWESQRIISGEERDALEVVHRRLLADEDHWIIDARRITLLQTILSTATWLTVVATLLTVWMLREEIAPPFRWLLPTGFTLVLLLPGYLARRDNDPLASATFLAGATLCAAPCLLAWFAECRLLAKPTPEVRQLFPGSFTNQQVFAATSIACLASCLCLWRLKMTGFAWTTVTLLTSGYAGALLLFNWLDQEPQVQAMWFLPLILMEAPALFFERIGRVRWTLPFHLVALAVLVVALDVMAYHGPTLRMLGAAPDTSGGYFNNDRLIAFSFVANGALFLAIMVATGRSPSLDLRRAGKLLETLGLVHVLSALFANALQHRSDEWVRVDVWLYVSAAIAVMVVASLRSRWRMLVGGLVGIGLGSYLLVDLGVVAKKPFVIALGCVGVLVALGTFAYVRRCSRSGSGPLISRKSHARAKAQ